MLKLKWDLNWCCNLSENLNGAVTFLKASSDFLPSSGDSLCIQFYA